MKRITDEQLQAAWQQYLNGEIGPWDFQALVEQAGFGGWTGNSDGTVTIHQKVA